MAFFDPPTPPADSDVSFSVSAGRLTPFANTQLQEHGQRKSVAKRRTHRPLYAPGVIVPLSAPTVNVAPSMAGVPFITNQSGPDDGMEVGHTLGAVPAAMAGVPTPAASWQWERDGVEIVGATSFVYELVSADAGALITVVQTASNAGGSASAESLPTDSIAQGLPTTTLQNRWASEGLTVGASASWLDTGNEGADLAKGFAVDPANGYEIDGHSTLDSNGLQAMTHPTTARTGAREEWVVLRPDDFSTQLVMDAISGGSRNTLFCDSTGDINANHGSTLAYALGFSEHVATLLRITDDGVGNGEVHIVTDAASAIAPVASGSIGTTDMLGITLGASRTGSSAWKGDVAEVLRYDTHLSNTDAQAVAAVLLAKYPSCAKALQTQRVVACLGDSHTSGLSATDNAYREALRVIFETTPLSATELVILRGNNNQGPTDHDGQSGNTLTQITARVANVAALSPACVVLWGGTNDCQNDDGAYDSVTTPAKLAATLAECFAQMPSVPVVLVNVMPLTNTLHNASVDDFNAEIPGIIAAADSTIFLADMNAVITDTATQTIDGVHLTGAASSDIAAPTIAAGVRLALA